MRIRRPSRPELTFKRKRSPPPQATKLLRASLAAAIVFMVLLAVVFLPRMFPSQPSVEIVNPANGGKLRLDTSAGTRLYVDATTVSLGLAKFNATFTHNVTNKIGTLGPGLGGGNATLSFTDGNANGLLDAGDYFGIVPPPGGCYHFEVFQIDVGSVAGYLEWGAGCP